MNEEEGIMRRAPAFAAGVCPGDVEAGAEKDAAVEAERRNAPRTAQEGSSAIGPQNPLFL